jgi:hypothetical protein
MNRDPSWQSNAGKPGGAASTPSGHSPRIDPPEPELPPAQAVRDSLAAFAELREYASYYVTAWFDRVRFTLRRAGFLAVVGAMALVAGCTIIVTSSVLVCVGLAQGIAAALGGRAWAGNLIVGLSLLALAGAGTWFGWSRLSAAFRRKMVQKYELRQRQQRADFGHDVEERAHEAG